MTTPAPRGSFVFDTRELGRRPGTMVEKRLSPAAVDMIGTEIIAVPVGVPVDLDLRLEAVLEGVLVSGSVQAKAVGACVRCLDEVEEDISADIQELFAYADRADHLREVGDSDDDTDQLVLDGDLLDLEPVVRDVVVTALPFQPLCDENCAGLCSECGARLADDPNHQHEMIDPRWAALTGLTETSGAPAEEKRN